MAVLVFWGLSLIEDIVRAIFFVPRLYNIIIKKV